jgi:hypothetical protein
MPGRNAVSHLLTIEVADDVFRPLVERAQRDGCTPESKAADLIAESVARITNTNIEPGPSLGLSPALSRWAGAIDSGIQDWADRHDAYLGKANGPQQEH